MSYVTLCKKSIYPLFLHFCIFLCLQINEFKDRFRKWRSTKLTGLIDSYFESLINNSNSENQISKDETKMLHELYFLSPDMQMLLNLLAEKEGMWSSILILSLFDKSFKNEFKVCI